VDDLAEIVKDTLDLAKVRAVDFDAMCGIEDEAPDGLGIGLLLPALLLSADPKAPGWAPEAVSDIMADWWPELLRSVWVDFRRELDKDVHPINSPSIEVGSIDVSGQIVPVVTISGLIASSAFLKGKYVQGQYATIPYAALFPGNTEILVDLAVESLLVKFTLAWKDPATIDLTVEDLEDANLGISAFGEDGNPVPLGVSFERIEDTWLWINEGGAQFPLFGIDLRGDGIKALSLDLGETVLLDKIYYASALVPFE
jgi:hypothetical protein